MNTDIKSTLRGFTFATITALGLAAGTNSAFATHAPGQPLDGLVGWDGDGDATINLDELGNASIIIGPNAFFGPYSVSINQIPATVNPAWKDGNGDPLEVTSYEFIGKGGLVPIQLAPGVVGVAEAVIQPLVDSVGLSDALIFTPLFVDNDGFGHSRIDFLSDNEIPFFMQYDKLVFEDLNDKAVYQAQSGYDFGDNNEKITYNIDSSAPDTAPDAGTTSSLLGIGVLGLAALRRKLSA